MSHRNFVVAIKRCKKFLLVSPKPVLNERKEKKDTQQQKQNVSMFGSYYDFITKKKTKIGRSSTIYYGIIKSTVTEIKQCGFILCRYVQWKPTLLNFFHCKSR